MLPLLVALLLLAATNDSRAAEQVAAFTVQPDRCIALNRGQVCYQSLNFQWQTAAGARYCLHQDDATVALTCWTGAESSTYALEFASDRNVTYRIRREGQAEVLAEVVVEVAWVYQSNRQSFSRWRLF
ncbi:MAG: DUF3019 domain-containing protein [Burkholderiales bacterium]